ncbi:MAG: PilZ domain-containing protein [Elusimicrobiota bacterium]|jgi:hypothetical protein
MRHANGKQSSERRKHRRFTVVHDLIEPIVLRYSEPKGEKAQGDIVPKHLRTQPAILTDLSAGGMSLITFLAPPHTKIFKMTLTVPGLDHLPIEGKVVRVDKKGETYSVGIQFTKVAQKYQSQINRMAEDDADCQTRIELGLPDACEPHCMFHRMCSKSQKAQHWPPRA